MRILLIHQGLLNRGLLDGAECGLPFESLSAALSDAGHEVRRLSFGDRRLANNGARAPSSADDPAAALPSGAEAFDEFTDRRLAAARDALRQALDAEIDAFNPHIVHVQPIWVLAHLALEAGAPYVLTASGAELPVYRLDPRFRRLAEEAAENAGRIVATSEAVRAETIAAFGDLDDRVVTLPPELASGNAILAAVAQWLVEIYRQVSIDRFGARPEG